MIDHSFDVIAEEAERISGFRGVDDLLPAMRIAERACEKNGALYWYNDNIQDGRWEFFRMVSAIWTAGYLAGRREERTKHKVSAK